MRNKKFVLDANIWISYFINNHTVFLTGLYRYKKIQLIYCNETLIEVSRVLNYPHLKNKNINIKISIDFIKSVGTFFKLKYPIKNFIPEDEADNYLIALALQTNAGFVTSGDKHILSQKSVLETKYKKLKIITKTEFEKVAQ